MAEGGRAELTRRVLSAAVLGGGALVGAALGGPWFVALVVAFVAGLSWEWARMCGGGRFEGPGVVLLGGCVAITVAAGLAGAHVWAVAAVLMLAVVVYGMARHRRSEAAAFLAGGAFYFVLPALSLLWLREGPEGRAALVIWMFVVVWAADTGAYVVGRAVGGPKLWPSLSPSKTWAGLAGGIAAAMAVGAVTGALFGGDAGLSAMVALPLACVAAGGDLLESAAKRRFAVKDSSRLIPGHGGILDRLDSILLAIPVVFVFVAAGGSWL